MHALDVMNDPIRRRVVELLAGADRAAGELTDVVQREFAVTQPAVSRHLRVLREADIVTADVDAQRRVYRLNERALREMSSMIERYTALWSQRLDALDTEIARGRAGRKP